MINKYPLQVGMSLNEIIAVKRTDIVEAAIIMIEELSLRYIDDPIYELDVKLAKKIITFISMLRHSGGDLGGVEFRLLPFQIEFVVISLAVVDRVSRNRKHTESILFIPRKNGKTELGAAINLWMLFGDVEKQKEIFVIASETNQAAILYGAVVSMLKQNKTLMKMGKKKFRKP